MHRNQEAMMKLETIVIARNQAVDKFCLVHENGSHTPTDIPASTPAGHAARIMAHRHKRAAIGVLGDTIGPMVRMIYGEILWMRDDFAAGCVFVKPMTWAGEKKFYVGLEPNNPDAGVGSQLGSYFIIVKDEGQAMAIANSEARKLGGAAIMCPHFVGFEGCKFEQVQ
jgi:hypothetical protein